MTLPEPASVHECRGPDGQNLLGFLAALGALISLSDAWPDRDVRLGWTRRLAWRPVLRVSPPCEQEELVHALHEELRSHEDAPEFTRLGSDLSVSVDAFRRFALAARDRAIMAHPREADFVAAYGSEAIARRGTIRPTLFKTQAGQQGFLKQVAKLVKHTTAHQIRATLFEPWTYDDDGHDLPDRREPSMRWDPVDDRRYALRADNPAKSRRFPTRTVRGANRLAVEGLRFFPAVPLGGALATVGFGSPDSATAWHLRWPTWDGFASPSVVRSLLTHPSLWEDPLPREELLRMGIHEVMECRRYVEESYGNFSVARPLLVSAS